MSKNKHNNQVGGAQIERSDDRINETGEVFTPLSLVYEMVDDIPDHIMSNPESTFLDNSAGDGNFPFALMDRLVNKYGHDIQHVRDNMIYVIEFMEDNHKALCERMGVPTTHPHYICGDGLDPTNLQFGEPQGLESFFV